MRGLILSILLFFSFCVYAEKYNTDVVPLPMFVELKGGEFTFDVNTSYKIEGVDAPDNGQLLKYLVKNCLNSSLTRKKNSGEICLKIVPCVGKYENPEAYTICARKKKIDVCASSAAGLFYAIQTIKQLLDRNGNRVPAVDIYDIPRFPYRGVMIDVSRNFRNKEFIKKQIDALSSLKINRLHLHLTDGAGWRLQIDKYPRLTEFAAWRKGETWKQWNGKYCEHDDADAHGGFFTKDDIREIVEYAASHYITVIPEIEMPAHSEEVLAAYPELSCAGEPYKQSDVCIGNEKSFEFFQNILDEVVELFPSQYIHIGGDEASKQAWKSCEKCQKRMADEGLKDVDELQSYMIHRIEQYLNSKGKSMIGWDEIMQGGLAPNATVLSWRGPQYGFKAAEEGHFAIMTPSRLCYLDAYQDAPFSQPEAIGGYLPISLMYSFDPAPDTISVKARNNILGVQASMFTEYIATDEHAEYMLYPRVLAIAEMGWTRQNLREFTDFRRRALAVNDKLKSDGYNVFDLHSEIGNRPESLESIDHIALGKKVIYNDCNWAEKYPASGESTFTDGVRGGWIYSDGRWQGFYNGDTDRALDVTIDLENLTDISFIGADFIKLSGPNVWFPEKVIISVSDDGENFTELTTILTEPVRDNVLSFKNISWNGKAKARYVRYQAFNRWRFVFTDEIVIK
ncbi:MAG: family 20 glycosylhydrolase [Muribaculaceae bacterium]|nr:family 20 glycosylhydrolase [Muribaculaceae bacterium]